jgi:hypothetical protein
MSDSGASADQLAAVSHHSDRKSLNRYNKGSVKERTAGQVMVARNLMNMDNRNIIAGYDIGSKESSPVKKARLDPLEEQTTTSSYVPISSYSSTSSYAQLSTHEAVNIATVTSSEKPKEEKNPRDDEKPKNVYNFYFH